jgi:hypothetical protein
VVVSDCKTLDFWKEPLLEAPYTTPRPLPGLVRAHSFPYDGSVMGEPGRGPHCSPRIPSESEEAIDSMTKPCSKDTPSIAKCNSGFFPGKTPPLNCYSDGWTEDSTDASWAVDFEDFASNSSDDSNSDWDLDVDVEDNIVEDVEFDLDGYSQFRIHDDPDWIDKIRATYSESKWNQRSTELLGKREAFYGPMPGPIQRQRRNVQPPQYFWHLFWDMAMPKLVTETNRYAKQAYVKRPIVTNGRETWTELTLQELKTFFGIVILMGMKQTPVVRDY